MTLFTTITHSSRHAYQHGAGSTVSDCVCLNVSVCACDGTYCGGHWLMSKHTHTHTHIALNGKWMFIKRQHCEWLTRVWCTFKNAIWYGWFISFNCAVCVCVCAKENNINKVHHFCSLFDQRFQFDAFKIQWLHSSSEIKKNHKIKRWKLTHQDMIFITSSYIIISLTVVMSIKSICRFQCWSRLIIRFP